MRCPQYPQITRDCSSARPSRGAGWRASPGVNAATFLFSVSWLRRYSSQSMNPTWASGMQTCHDSMATLAWRTVPSGRVRVRVRP